MLGLGTDVSESCRAKKLFGWVVEKPCSDPALDKWLGKAAVPSLFGAVATALRKELPGCAEEKRCSDPALDRGLRGAAVPLFVGAVAIALKEMSSYALSKL